MSAHQARRKRRAAERQARKAANQANAQLSTGPKSEEGKAIVSQNNFRHGLSGAFQVLASESQQDFDALAGKLSAEHNPVNPLEAELVEEMARHLWLARRAVSLQEKCFDANGEVPEPNQKQFALYLRYQTTHERAFHKFTEELRKLRNEKRKIEIGFESQKRNKAEDARKEAVETRRQELHKWAALLAQAEYEHQELLNVGVETPECRIPNRIERILAADNTTYVYASELEARPSASTLKVAG